jgi:carboxyl-terminal processing protease
MLGFGSDEADARSGAPSRLRDGEGARMFKVLAALALLLAVVGPACALTQPGNRVENAAALERFRAEFPRVSGGLQVAAGDRPYRLFAEVMRRAQGEHVRPQPPLVMAEKALAAIEAKHKADRNLAALALTEAGLDAMLGALDPYSSYLDAENFRYMREQTQGEFGGLGIEVTMDEESGLVRVVSPIDGSPAARAGLRSGDLIARIDEQPVKGMNLRDAVAKMRGPVGSHVALSLKRSNIDNLLRVSLTRAVVKIQPVRWRLEENVGYIRIAAFNQSTAQTLDEALIDLRRQSNGKLAGAVIDLRNNPGGLLDQAVAVADRFLEAVEIVSIRGRDPDDNRRYVGAAGDQMVGLPLVVLVNSGSASASEIVAGALQDHARALIFGVRTYGKGSVQTISSLNGDSGIRLTTARYHRPSGATVDCYGVTPNVEVRAAEPRSEEIHAEAAACDPQAKPPGNVQHWTMDIMCPTVADVRPAPDAVIKEENDVAVHCAVSAIRTRLMGAKVGQN